MLLTSNFLSSSSSRHALARSLVAGLLAAFGAGTALADFKVLVNPGDQEEQSRGVVYSAWRNATEVALKTDKSGNASWAVSTSTTEDLSATRSRLNDVIVGPAHLIGSAIRYGYTPVLGLDQPVQAVLVAAADSQINDLAQAAGKKLGLPLQDSLVTYLLRGEVNAANTTVKRHFASVYQTRWQDALLLCLQMRQCDVIGVERGVYDRWIAQGKKLKVVLSSKSVPGLSVAIKEGSKPGATVLQNELAKAIAKPGSNLENFRIQPLATRDFEYVSTLGYFTPRQLPGAKVLDAAGVAALIKQGARVIDTRNAAEFKEGHVPGAVLVPYVEKSAKDADFDASLDKFEIEKLGTDRDAALIFGCNGAECWKSFKASHAAIKAGYKAVYWFRGGFPEWRAAGLETGVPSDTHLATASGK